MGAGQAARHWDAIYATHGADDVSWAQRDPGPSLAALDALEVDHTEAVVDVGGGTSAFAGALAQRGFIDITVLDLSLEALNAGKSRHEIESITWQLGDVLDWRPEREYGLWHDRAVFHFLTDGTDRQRYREVLNAAVAPSGAIIVEPFAPDGPDRCSGLRSRATAPPPWPTSSAPASASSPQDTTRTARPPEPVGPATTASLVVIAVAASVGAGSLARGGHICWRPALTFSTPAAAGSLAGAIANKHVSGPALIIAFVPVMITAAFATWRRAGTSDPPTEETSDCPHVGLFQIAAAGLAVGLLTGFFGVGGGRNNRCRSRARHTDRGATPPARPRTRVLDRRRARRRLSPGRHARVPRPARQLTTAA